MKESDLIYDIRKSTNALQTLINLTGVSLSVWCQYHDREREYEYNIDYLVADVVNSYGHLPRDYRDFQFIYFHITTSANKCASFRQHGILDLKESYLCYDSELRNFLEKYDVHIDLNAQTLTYHGKIFNISYGACPRRETVDYKCWSVGRKFYYDYTTCGFLSVGETPYGGQVHLRPEILYDIDNLLELNLSETWMSTHSAYEVLVKVRGEKIVYNGDENKSETDKVISYLTDAYYTAFQGPDENVLLLKNNVQIPASDILEIKPLDCWKENSHY